MAAGSETPDRHHKSNKKNKNKRRKRDNEQQHPPPPPPPPSPPAPEIVEATVKVMKSSAEEEKSLPLVGYFPSGFNPQAASDSDTQVKVYRNRTHVKKSRLQLVVSPSGSSSSDVNFVGSSYSGEMANPKVCNYGLGVLDKSTNTLKIVPIAADKVFRLEARVRGVAYSEPADMEVEELTVEKKAAKMRELTATYGTKKSINQAKKLHALRQDADPNSQKVLDMKINELEINKEALAATSAHTAHNIPEHDISATTPEGAYPLEKIILKGEWAFLEDIYYLLQDETEVSSDTYPSFVCNRFHKLHAVKDEGEQRRLCAIFSYITHLIKFKDQYTMDKSLFGKDRTIPSILHQKFTTMFASAESMKRLSSEKIGLLISYVLVLTLHADEFKSDPTDIAKDLRMSPLSLRAHYEHLGCKLSRKNNILWASLSVPLKFPEMRRSRGKR